MSAGRLRMIVENAAYAKVDTAKHATSAERRRPHRRHEQHHPEAADDRDCLSRGPHAPAAPDQPARDAPAEEVAEIGREEWYPEADEALLELEAARHEIDRRTSR